MKFQNLDGKQFMNTLSQQTNAVVLDVRTPSEFDAFHLEKAMNVDIKNRDFVEEINELEKDKSYFVYCRIGIRSANACNYMAMLGFKNLYNLKGGIEALEK